MNPSSESEIPEHTEDSVSKPLPNGFLNALDDTVKEEIHWIIDKVFAEGEQMLVFGAPKVGKSQFGLQLAMAIALGEPFLNWQIKKRRRVLYLNFEMGKHIFMLRIARHFCYAVEAKKLRAIQEGLEEMDLDPENRSKESKWLDFEDDTPPDDDLMKKINSGIKDYLFFCGELRGLESKIIDGNYDPDEINKTDKAKTGGKKDKDERELSEQTIVKQWQAIMDAIKPELIIFDTLSKTHAIDESNNSEIQRVLLRLREICSVAVPTTNDPDKASGNDGIKRRKEIAHVIIHHARKMSGDFYKNGGNYVSLDNIRGGSAIRAEADLIFGIFAAANKPTSTHEATNRTISVEARNLAIDPQYVNFKRFAFSYPRQRTPEFEESLGDILTEHIRHAFVQSGMRGLTIETLKTKVWDELERAGRQKEFTLNQVGRTLKTLAENSNSQYEIREKQGNEKDTAQYPHERKPGKILYWIKEGSPWLDDEPLNTAIMNHKPHPLRKGGKSVKP